MYAYKQQFVENDLYTNIPRKVVSRPIKNKSLSKKVKKKNKKNIFLEFIRSFICVALLCAYAYFIHPTAYNSLIKQVFIPTKIKTDIKYTNQFNGNKNLKPMPVNLYSLSNPLVNYLYNDMYNNQVLLTPLRNKKYNEVTTIYETKEMPELKNQLLELMKKYPTIKPAIYVWEYENGRYLNINADEQYPAASIIKLPVLVRMFKSIEANQFTIYDEMKMLEQYRSSGSGNLQYASANRSYTMDYLAKVMIEDSDNTSTNMIMAKMGGMFDVNAGLREWGLSKTYLRTWLPDLGGTNKTTASDMAKILYNLDNPGFLNINSREYIIDYMSHVKNNRLIQAGLGEGALFIHKTGDIGTMLGDAGIVYAPNGTKYIIVILAKRPHNAPQGKEFIIDASRMIYNYIIQ